MFDVDAFGAWAERARERGLFERVSLLAGTAVPSSAKGAQFLRGLPGVAVPDAVIRRLDEAGPAAAEEGVRVTAEVIARLKAVRGVAGVHLMGLGRPESVTATVQAAGLYPRPVV